jgi:glycosyltransferase involved in cell wall biosynthesis
VLKQFYYDECSKYSEDYNLWLKLVSSGYTINKLTNTLLLYRVIESSLTQKSNQLKYGGYKKNILAKYCLLRYKTIKGVFNHFDQQVIKSMFQDMGRVLKTFLKEPLRNFCIKTGRLFWYIYPQKYLNIDILFIFKNANMGGAERVQLEVLKAAKAYRRLTLLTHKNKDAHFLKKYMKYTKIQDISFISNMIFGRWIAAGYFQKVIEHSQIKLVFGSLSGLLYDIVPTARKGDTQFIDLFHALDHNIEYYSFASVKGLEKRIVIDSNTGSKLKELYRKKGLNDVLYADKIHLIENGVYIPDTYLEQKSTADFTVLFVGRDAPVKRVFLIREIARKLKYIKFILVGVEASSSDPDNVNALGKVKETASLYSQADVLLLVSEREGFPMVVMEAMAYGVVPVCTNVGGLSRHIIDGKNGFLLDNGMEKDIISNGVNVLQKLSNDKNMLKIMAEASYRYAKIHFDEKRFSRQYKELFKMYIVRRR